MSEADGQGGCVTGRGEEASSGCRTGVPQLSQTCHAKKEDEAKTETEKVGPKVEQGLHAAYCTHTVLHFMNRNPAGSSTVILSSSALNGCLIMRAGECRRTVHLGKLTTCFATSVFKLKSEMRSPDKTTCV